MYFRNLYMHNTKHNQHESNTKTKTYKTNLKNKKSFYFTKLTTI
jgi:hypothetical protein